MYWLNLNYVLYFIMFMCTKTFVKAVCKCIIDFLWLIEFELSAFVFNVIYVIMFMCDYKIC